MTKNIKQKIQKLRAFCEMEGIALAADNVEIFNGRNSHFIDFIALGGKLIDCDDRIDVKNGESYDVSAKAITRVKYNPYL